MVEYNDDLSLAEAERIVAENESVNQIVSPNEVQK
jgi:hypothetical protein